MNLPFLVLSHRHEMIPIAHRLRLEGEDVQLVVWPAGKSFRFERAWDGSFEQIIKGSDGDLNDGLIDNLTNDANQGRFMVVTNSYSAGNRFKDAKHLYSVRRSRDIQDPVSPIRIGAWFDGERFHAPHGLLVDMGAWPGGLGPFVPGAMTLVRFDTASANALFDSIGSVEIDHLKSANFRGLVQYGLDIDTASGIPRVDGERRGWPWLHTHAFLSSIEGFGEVLRGKAPVLPKKYVVVAPVTIPPWPTMTSEGSKKIVVEGLTPIYQGRCFWHDVQIDAENQQILTAGLDGMVAVVRGEADTVEWARAQAMELACSMQLPQKQFRPDMASEASKILGGLEGSLGIVV